MLKLNPVSYKKLVCVFEKYGFVHSRTKGDHLIYTKKHNSRPLVIPMYNQIPLFVIKNLIRTAGIAREEYLATLRQC